MTAAAPLLAVRNVSVNFGGIAALANVSFDVHEGGVLALIGPNGAGKTTLLNVISGMLAPSSGEVAFEQKPIQRCSSHEINRLGLARTFQGAEIFGQLTVRENVMAGGVAASKLGFFAGFGWAKAGRVAQALERRADEVLEFVGLGALASKSAANLPAGQQRLLAIARALATNPRLLLLDEPGAGLSETEKLALVEVIETLARQGLNVVLVEHDMNVVGQLSNRIVVLDQGRVIADGEPRAVRCDRRVIEAYLGTSCTPRRHDTGEAQQRTSLLNVKNLHVHYGGVVALDNVSIDVNRGEIVAILGANGAGKSTLLKSIADLVQGEGSIVFDGDSIAHATADVIVRRGVSLTPEGRELFPSLSVEDNLILGRYASLQGRWLTSIFYRFSRERQAMDQRLERVHAIFPILRERRQQLAGTLSGGQAQMLAIARSLMSEPALLMLDEPSLGLAPQVIDDILATLVELRNQGITILLVEQNARAALQIADRAYVLANGAIAMAGSAHELLRDPEITSAYLGGQGQGEVLEPAVPMSANDFGSRV